jgi:DNA repair protein RecO (recombination protein O)
MVNGVRTDKKKSMTANMFQPAMMLDAVVYHAPAKNLQRIKELKPLVHYTTILQDVYKNTIAIFCIELITKTIIEPEENTELYEFIESMLLYIDKTENKLLANFPIYFTLQLSEKLGFGIENNYSTINSIFDVQNGQFTSFENLQHIDYLEKEMAELLHNFIVANYEICMMQTSNHTERNVLLKKILQFLKYQIPHMNELKCLDILHEIVK